MGIRAQTCLYFWRPASGTNFGDELSWHIVLAMLRQQGLSADRLERCRRYRFPRRRVFAIGSILHQCRAGDIVWGSGINGKIGVQGYDFSGVEFRSVRGPLSRLMVERHGGECPEVYGDPALLTPRLFPELAAATDRASRHPVTLIGNLNDEALGDMAQPSQANRVSPTLDWRSVTTEILSSDFVVSSSLHGIILADAYGIPCRPLQSLFESPFKYEDYFLSTGRCGVQAARDLDQALELGPVPAAQFDGDALFNAFPGDAFPK